jgi:hypothetical protein
LCLSNALSSAFFLSAGTKVMLDSHLAELYQVATGNLNLAVRRNIERFTDDFIGNLLACNSVQGSIASMAILASIAI